MAVVFQVLASGSKGNAILVCSEKTCILVDAGLSGKELAKRMEGSGFSAKKLDGVVVTHEHQDHIRGIGVISRRYDVPVYLSPGTVEGLPSQVGQLTGIQLFQGGNSFMIGDLRITPFAISHDAREPVGLTITNNGLKLGICTDLGVATQLVKHRLRSCQALIIEANHDPEMLMSGPYPPHLKQRIRSRHGHLSNAEACDLLEDLFHEKLRTVVLAHLSETNNHPELVLKSLSALRCSPLWDKVRFSIGMQHQASPAFEL